MDQRKQFLQDAHGLVKFLPAELLANLEATVSEEARPHVVQLQILAVQFGRALERQETKVRRIEANLRGRRPSELAKGMVDSLLVAPGFVKLDKKN